MTPGLSRILSGGPCVRVYHCWTLKPGKQQKPKIFQDQGTVVVKDYGQTSSQSQGTHAARDKMFFVSIGTPLRQLAWAYKKRIEKGREGVTVQVFVSSFLVPLATYEKIVRKAVLDTAKGSGDYKNIDPATPNQFGIRKAREFVDDIVPRSLVTYCDDQTAEFVKLAGAELGTTRSISDLRRMVGAPEDIGFETPILKVDLFVNASSGKFPSNVIFSRKSPGATSSKSFVGFADECSHAIGLWLGQRAKGLLRSKFEEMKPSEFEARRDEGLSKFLQPFGYDLPPKWRAYAERVRQAVDASEDEHFADIASDPPALALEKGEAAAYLESAAAFERNLGVYLANHADAMHAASEMCTRLRERFRAAGMNDLSAVARDPESAGSVPNDPFQLELVVTQGNLREKLTWVLFGAIRGGLAAAVFEEDLRNLAAKLGVAPRTEEGKILIPKMADETGERTDVQRIEIKDSTKYTQQRELDVSHPPMSLAERRHTLDKSGKLLWEPGGRVFQFREDAPYALDSAARLRLIAAGASGATYAMLYVAHFLGVDLLHARLAFLTWMITVGDHSFHEIMEGASRWGRDNRVPDLAYHGGNSPRRYRSLAPLTQYELRRFVCDNGQFPDEHL